MNRLIDECISEDGEALELNGKFIGDEGVEALVSTNRNFDVENLDLSRNKLTWRGAHHLFHSHQFKNLKRLLISNSINNNLKKGFVILEKSNKIIRQSNQLNKIDTLKIKFFDRKIGVKIEKT